MGSSAALTAVFVVVLACGGVSVTTRVSALQGTTSNISKLTTTPGRVSKVASIDLLGLPIGGNRNYVGSVAGVKDMFYTLQANNSDKGNCIVAVNLTTQQVEYTITNHSFSEAPFLKIRPTPDARYLLVTLIDSATPPTNVYDHQGKYLYTTDKYLWPENPINYRYVDGIIYYTVSVPNFHIAAFHAATGESVANYAPINGLFTSSIGFRFPHQGSDHLLPLAAVRMPNCTQFNPALCWLAIVNVHTRVTVANFTNLASGSEYYGSSDRHYFLTNTTRSGQPLLIYSKLTGKLVASIKTNEATLGIMHAVPPALSSDDQHVTILWATFNAKVSLSVVQVNTSEITSTVFVDAPLPGDQTAIPAGHLSLWTSQDVSRATGNSSPRFTSFSYPGGKLIVNDTSSSTRTPESIQEVAALGQTDLVLSQRSISCRQGYSSPATLAVRSAASGEEVMKEAYRHCVTFAMLDHFFVVTNNTTAEVYKFE